ncbi:sensor histidine kinase [Amycolatopsis sp. NPDC059657]|uniref:sensor histidine kinase n=1 Tax=Amycolatopsis sp. NPDC059657 TaxID=3346899 RepID=UPI00367295CF
MSTEGLSIPGISVGGPGAGVTDRVKSKLASDRPALLRRPAVLALTVDVVSIMFAVLDVWLVIPVKAQPYSIYLSGAACLALALRRWFPFATLLLTVPGFLAGWSQLAAMIALGMLATRKQTHWQTWVGAGLVWMCRFVQWPLEDFAKLSWREHVLDGIYGVLVAGMPVAIGLLIGARTELSKKLAELAASRDREHRLHADAVRAEERARLAREMHDVVSHQITLIAMQAGALQSQSSEPSSLQTAQVIRDLSKSTLEELRSLVGVLRSGSDDDGPRYGIEELDRLIRASDVSVHLTVEQVPETLPRQISAAAYRTVQECLTNVHKHAPGATATIRIQGGHDALKVEVRNARAAGIGGDFPSGGHGLTGLAERARLLGGSFETCDTEDGGFRVRARYPLAR